MLNERPGCFMRLGIGVKTGDVAALQHVIQFNSDVIPIGVPFGCDRVNLTDSLVRYLLGPVLKH